MNREDIAREYLELADLLEKAPPSLWEMPSLCSRWHAREVVAHMTMPARWSVDEFLAELHAAGGDFGELSNQLATRDGAASPTDLLADLRSPLLHVWEPPGGGRDDALVHAVMHSLDVTEATPLNRRVPSRTIATVLALVGDGHTFDVDLDGVELRASDLDWTHGAGQLVSGPAQLLALVACGRRLPAGRLKGDGAARFEQP